MLGIAGGYTYLYEKYPGEVIVTVARYAANILSEKSGYLSLISYYDNPDISDLVQFRMRRNQNFRMLDLRDVIEKFNIEDGGGHPGAVGFRMPSGNMDDIEVYVQTLISESELMIDNQKLFTVEE